MRAKNKSPDWKAIAYELGQRVNLAISSLHAMSGGGVMMDMKTGDSQSWKDYFADGLEMLPGVTVDRKKMHMTPAQRRKARKP